MSDAIIRPTAASEASISSVHAQPQNQQQSSRGGKGGSVMMNYFLVILFSFGCLQFYFNISTSFDFHHQTNHIQAFQRKHFIKSHSKSRGTKSSMTTSKIGLQQRDFSTTKEDFTSQQDRNDNVDSQDNNANLVEYDEHNQQQQHQEGDDEEEEFDDDAAEERKKHVLAGLNCDRFGGPSEEDAAEMVFWEDIPSDSMHVSPFQKPNQKQYLTFESDHGGWNNIRMAMETTLTMAVAMGRTLVLPPAQGMYLLGKPKSEHTGKQQSKDFTFSDFFHMESIADEHVGMEVITMKQFLEREGLAGNLRDVNTGKVVFPPNNRTDYEGANHYDIANTLESYLRKVGLVPPWDPEECLAAFPATTDPKDVAAIQDMFAKVDSFPTFETFIGHPVPVNASAIDRLKENRADRKALCIYDKKWQDVQVIHFGEGGKGEEGARLLVHFYAFLFFQDWKHDLWMKRFVRDHVRYIDEIQCAAARIVKELRARSRAKGDPNGDYNAYHIRRGDFQYTVTRYDSPRIIKNSAKEMTMGGVVYIASDETDPNFFAPLREIFDVVMLDDFKHLLVDVNTNYHGMIDSLIASRAKIFFGCWFSTFTGYINRLRGFHNNKRKGPGYEMGYHSSYYYALDDRKYHLQEYYPVKKSFYAREFPTVWRLIDEGIDELAKATMKQNSDGKYSNVTL